MYLHGKSKTGTWDWKEELATWLSQPGAPFSKIVPGFVPCQLSQSIPISSASLNVKRSIDITPGYTQLPATKWVGVGAHGLPLHLSLSAFVRAGVKYKVCFHSPCPDCNPNLFWGTHVWTGLASVMMSSLIKQPANLHCCLRNDIWKVVSEAEDHTLVQTISVGRQGRGNELGRKYLGRQHAFRCCLSSRPPTSWRNNTQ